MSRVPRVDLGGVYYHVLNRANRRARIFHRPEDYQAFERVLGEALERHPMRVLAYCLMPNHWHFVLWPKEDGDLSRFMHWLTLTHTQRWHTYRELTGTGHLYQGRFRSFPVQPGLHLYRVLAYVERNPLRAGLVDRAEAWPWGSLWRRRDLNRIGPEFLSPWPAGEPDDWLRRVNREVEDEQELARIREASQRGSPFGSDAWTERTAKRLGLETSLRPRGRPRKRTT